MIALINPVRKIELKIVLYSILSNNKLFLTKKAMNKAKDATERSNTNINHLGTTLSLFKA